MKENERKCKKMQENERKWEKMKENEGPGRPRQKERFLVDLGSGFRVMLLL